VGTLPNLVHGCSQKPNGRLRFNRYFASYRHGGFWANDWLAMVINYTGLYILQSYILLYQMIAANLSVNAATNIYILVPFSGSLGQIGAGLVVKYLKRYKWIVVSGYGIIVLGMGLTYKYINGHGQMPQLVVSQIILGIGEGIVMTTQFGVQASISQSGRYPFYHSL
jgi:hypothetical protein